MHTDHTVCRVLLVEVCEIFWDAAMIPYHATHNRWLHGNGRICPEKRPRTNGGLHECPVCPSDSRFAEDSHIFHITSLNSKPQNALKWSQFYPHWCRRSFVKSPNLSCENRVQGIPGCTDKRIFQKVPLLFNASLVVYFELVRGQIVYGCSMHVVTVCWYGVTSYHYLLEVLLNHISTNSKRLVAASILQLEKRSKDASPGRGTWDSCWKSRCPAQGAHGCSLECVSTINLL